MRWWLAAALLAGCVEPQLQRCGDLLCSADSVCLNNAQCATPESIEACKNLSDGMACSTAVFTGNCLNGACTAPRCGDGIVSGSEQCDGPVSSGVDCVTYGFDTGVPSCTAVCALDVVESCVRFGWEKVASASAELAWTNGTEVAVVPPDRKHVVVYSASSQVVASETITGNKTIHTLVGHDHSVAVGIDGAILRSDAGAAFAPVALGPIPAAQYELAFDDTGSLIVAIFDSNTRIWKEVGTGAWQMILSLPQSGSFLKFVDGFLYAGFTNGEVRRWNGAWSSTLFTAPSPLTDIAAVGGSFFISTASSGNYEVVGTTLTAVGSKMFPNALASGDAVYFGGDDIGLLRRTNDSRLEIIDAPIFGRLTTDGTNVFIYGNGVYRYSGTQFARRAGVNEPPADAVLFASGEIGVASLTKVMTVASPDTWSFTVPAEPPVALAGRSKTDFYVTGGHIVEHSNGATLTTVPNPSFSIGVLEDLAWQDATNTLFAVGTGGTSLKRVGTNWIPFGQVQCDFHQLALHATSVYAVGTCGSDGVIWQLNANGSDWTELQRISTPLRSLWADDADNLYAAGPDGGTSRVAGMWRAESNARGVSISATSPSDIWVGGGPDDLIHYDGTAWSRVRIVGAASPRVVATPRSVYIAGATTSVLAR
jgi:hypothetical protein